MTTYFVNEIFDSIQGEGVLAGVPATFVRLQGCDVGCHWCDTKYAWGASGGTEMSVEDIVARIQKTHIVITGGEPMMHDLDNLFGGIRKSRWDAYIQLETSGRYSFTSKRRPDWLTWSPKERLNFEAPKDILYFVHEVKWVVDEAFDFDVVLKMWDRIRYMRAGHPPIFVLMPEGLPPKEDNITNILTWLRNPHDGEFRYGDRLQARLGVK